MILSSDHIGTCKFEHLLIFLGGVIFDCLVDHADRNSLPAFWILAREVKRNAKFYQGIINTRGEKL